MARIEILIEAVSDHFRAKFGVLRRFPDEKLVNRPLKNFHPTLKVFGFQKRFLVQHLMNGEWITEINRFAEQNFFPKINDYRQMRG